MTFDSQIEQKINALLSLGVPLFCLVSVKSLLFCHQLMIDSVGFDGADVRGIELVSEDVRRGIKGNEGSCVYNSAGFELQSLQT